MDYAPAVNADKIEKHFDVIVDASDKITAKLETLREECYNDTTGLKEKIRTLKVREKKEYETKYKMYKKQRETAEDEMTLMISNNQRKDLVAKQKTNFIIYSFGTILRNLSISIRWIYALLITLLVIFPIFLTCSYYAVPELAGMQVNETNFGQLVFFSDAIGITFALYIFLCNSRFGNRNVSAKTLMFAGVLLVALLMSLLLYDFLFTIRWEVAEVIFVAAVGIPLSMILGIMYAKSRVHLSTKFALLVIVGVMAPLIYILPRMDNRMRPAQIMICIAVPTMSFAIFGFSLIEKIYNFDSVKALSYMFLFIVFPLFVIIPISAPNGLSIEKLMQRDPDEGFSQYVILFSLLIAAVSILALVIATVYRVTVGRRFLNYMRPKYIREQIQKLLEEVELYYWVLHIMILLIEISILITAYRLALPSSRYGLLVLSMAVPVIHTVGFSGLNAKLKYRHQIMVLIFCFIPLLSGIVILFLFKDTGSNITSLGLGLIVIPPALTVFWILLWAGKDYLSNKKFRNYELVLARTAVIFCLVCMIPFGIGLPTLLSLNFQEDYSVANVLSTYFLSPPYPYCA